MSHFQKVRLQIREQEHLTHALRDLHYQFQEGDNLLVRGFGGNKERAQVVVDTGCEYDIGFQRREDAFECVADWWGVQRGSKIREQEFLQQVNHRYSYNLIRDQAREQNLIFEEEQIQENGDVIIILSERG